jgi:hypothetical protein
MKSTITALLFLIALGLLYGCSEDCDPCSVAPTQVQPLAQIIRESSSGSSGSYDTLRLILEYTAEQCTLYEILVTESNEGSTFTIDVDGSNNPDLAEAVARLTNGVDEQMMIWTLTYPGGGGVGMGTAESRFLDGGLTNDMYPDLAGAEVTKILIHIDYISIYVVAGPVTNFDCDIRVVFMGRL